MKFYEKPELEIVIFNTEDILDGSGDIDREPGSGSDKDDGRPLPGQPLRIE